MAVALSPLPLKEGSNGDSVNRIQYLLQVLKLYSSPIDGVFGSKTKEAVLKFQAANGLTQDGIVGVNTTIALDIQAWGAQQDLLREGYAGESVKNFQGMYNSYFGNLAVDGVFGPKTKAEVIKFQESRGLVADGVVGAKTWASLYSLVNHDIPTDQRISAIFDPVEC